MDVAGSGGAEGVRAGIDIGGTGIKAAMVDLAAGQLASERVRRLTPQPATPEAVAQVAADVLGEVAGVGPVGIAVPAVVRDGVVETAANIDPSWIGTPARELFSDVLGRPCVVMNDADAAGVAEMRFGAGRGVHGVTVMVTLGTGIGSAVFVDGWLVPNTELGHLHLHDGEAEDWAADSVREAEDLSWKEWATRVDVYLLHLEALLWPSLFIVGGGVSKKADKFVPRLTVRTPVVPAELRNEAGIVGAALVASEVGDLT